MNAGTHRLERHERTIDHAFRFTEEVTARGRVGTTTKLEPTPSTRQGASNRRVSRTDHWSRYPHWAVDSQQAEIVGRVLLTAQLMRDRI